MWEKVKQRAILNAGFNDLPYLPMFIILAAILQPLLFKSMLPWVTPKEYFSEFLGSIGFTAIIWLIIRAVIMRTHEKWGHKKNYVSYIWLQGIAVAILSTLLGIGIAKLLQFILQVPPEITTKYKNAWVISPLTSLVVLGFYEASFAQSKWRRSQLETERLKQANTDSQLATLKSQINPHFLFNSLNTLAALIPENPDTAVKFVTQLSKVYRYILEMSKTQIVSLQEEIDCALAFSYLLETRFGQNISISFENQTSEKDLFIAPLSLQILLENAVKHNIVSTKKPLRIVVTILNEKIIIENNFQPKSTLNNSTKTGLKNIALRYELLAGLPIETIQTNEKFSVVLPLIKLEHHEATTH